MASEATLEIHRLLEPSAVSVSLSGTTKAEIIDGLIELIEDSPAVYDVDRLRQAVLDREEIMSTGVGKGLALPHAKTDAVAETVVAFAITEQPVEFGSIDNKPVRLVFLMVGPEGARSQHIKMLSRVSRLMNREAFREQLLEARTPDAVIEAFRNGEEQMMDG